MFSCQPTVGLVVFKVKQIILFTQAAFFNGLNTTQVVIPFSCIEISWFDKNFYFVILQIFKDFFFLVLQGYKNTSEIQI
jgi:hypothetical protein